VTSTTIYDAVGGQPFFDALVDRFYAAVERDPLLRPMYPGDDLAPARRRLALFLAQYWGGPTAYSDERGHPRLRMRHAGFAVDGAARQAWLAAMFGALDAAAIDGEHAAEIRSRMREYFEMAADHMINRPG
jgi:hemoglobin